MKFFLTTWQSLVPGAFAGMTAPFGVHPNDRERALKMFRLALRQGATLTDVVTEAAEYLRKAGCTDQWIEREADRIKSFRSCPFNKPRSTRSWLITLDENGVSEIITIMKVQRSARFVLKYVEQYYISRFYSIQEKLAYSIHSKNNPYRAVFEEVNGRQYIGRIRCGENPAIYARHVKNLWIDTSSGVDILKWDEEDILQ